MAVVKPPKIVTLQRHIMEAQSLHPQATGEFTRLLWDLTLAIKMIAWEVNRAGLVREILGSASGQNTSGDRQMKLDVYAQERIYQAMDHGGHLCCMASEEVEDVILIPKQYPRGKYVLLFDPLDGSSNIEANVSVGTIFSIHRKITPGLDGSLADCLQRGSQQVAAGYVIYGSSTMLVYTTGQGVHGFTLDPSVGEFLLSHENLQIPSRGKIYSVNEGNTCFWDQGTLNYINHIKKHHPPSGRPYSCRYVGSLVADFHRNLLYGGIFLYPADHRDPIKPKGKLRLLYEAAPLSFIVEQAGGLSSVGTERILDLQPKELHQKVPLIIGSREEVELYEAFFQGKRKE